MSSISFDLSGKIDQETLAALSALKKITDSLNIPFFIVGATARDFLLKHCFGINPPRMTRDIDLAVEVADWEQFGKLTDALKDSRIFSADRKEPQRFRYDNVPIDIVPFGPISDRDVRISWPPEHEIFMNMMGFQEAYQCSVTVRLRPDPELDVKIPTLPGLALMKLISWNEKYPERKKDAEDLLFIMQKYEDAGNYDRLYGSAQNILMEESFDTRLAGIRLLGHDMAQIAASETLATVQNIIRIETGEHSQHRLIIHMLGGMISFENKFDDALLFLEKLKEGLSGFQEEYE